MRIFSRPQFKAITGMTGLLAVSFTCLAAHGAALKKTAPPSLTASGNGLMKRYSDMLKVAQTDLAKALPKMDEAKKAAFIKAHEAQCAAATALADAKKASLDDSVKDKAAMGNRIKSAKEALEKAKKDSEAPVQAMLAFLDSYLTNDKADMSLMRGAIISNATPRGLAEYAQQGREQATFVDYLLSSATLMRQMLEGGGAEDGKYGQALQIYSAIMKASPKAREGVYQRLAMAVSLEHAAPVSQSNADDQTKAPTIVDPVKRYLHYEKAFADGELDDAFKNLTVWEMRMAVNCDAPDHILAWGREMLRNYRPDHIYNPDHGWRYSYTVRTEVPYGSQNVKYDLPSLHHYQNIIMNGGVCGRRAFFGRFILRSFGIPVWGVTQHKHAALSHWTPKGWVVNLGAGYEWSWWDKDDAPRSGSDFLLETQARAHPQDYAKVLRAQWTSDIFGEEDYNDRKGVAGGFWSGVAHQETAVIAAKEVELGPLGQELAEANDSNDKESMAQVQVKEADCRLGFRDGSIILPAVAYGLPDGRYATMKSFSEGFQMHCLGGFKTEYEFNLPSGGKYALSARVVTVQKGQKMIFTANESKAPVEVDVPYTVGKWEQTKPVQITLATGKNVLGFALQDGSRGVTIKEFALKKLN